MPGKGTTRRDFLKLTGLGAASLTLPGCLPAGPETSASNLGRPNIVYIIADDMGYGDVHCLNPNGKIPTPHMDQLAKQGMIFTDAHSGSSVCSPTRYGILTGRYAWRSPLKMGVLDAYSSPLIAPERMTVASLLKQHGYHTACIGKWHLGYNWTLTDGSTLDVREVPGHYRPPKTDIDKVDYSQGVTGGPGDLGFDYSYITTWCHDPENSQPSAPSFIIKNDRTVGVNVPGKDFVRRGLAAVDRMPLITQKAVEYINQRAAVDKQPFFLYLPLTAPHLPIVPSPPFAGKTNLGPYADFVYELDATVGQVTRTLEQCNLADNTLVIMTSDNGALDHLGQRGHQSNHHFRGWKADIHDGGHRIPFIARWPGKIKPNSTCSDIICLTDLLATVADLAGATLPDNAGEDSVSILPDLLGTAKHPARETIVHHSFFGFFAIRQGKWKLVLTPGSGGWTQPTHYTAQQKKMPPVQLYDLSTDISEKHNLRDKHPEVVERLTRLLQKYVDQGRSTPGAPQPNEGKVNIWGFRPPSR